MKVNRQKTITQNGDCVSKNPASAKKAETRPDWAILYPIRKRQAWHSDFSGITRLAENGQLYWLNVWHPAKELSEPRGFGLSIKPKDGTGKPISCQLSAVQGHSGRYYIGPLQLGDTGYLVELQEDAGRLRVHFVREGGES